MGVNSPFHRDVIYLVPVTPVMEVHTLSLRVFVNAQALTKRIHPDRSAAR